MRLNKPLKLSAAGRRTKVGSMVMLPWEPRNHNDHYHDRLGCGCGFFAARLASAADQVDAIDSDGGALADASRLHSSARITFREGDFLEMGLPSDAYDVVTSIAALHHMDFERALGEMKRVLRPAGRLAELPPHTHRRAKGPRCNCDDRSDENACIVARADPEVRVRGPSGSADR